MTIDDRAFYSLDGWIAFIYGPMFSGKSGELIRLLSRAKNYAMLDVQAFKSVIDTRYGQGIKSHDGSFFEAIDVENSQQILERLKNYTQVIGISEVQFLDDGLIDVCIGLKNADKKIVLEGLLLDYKHEPFPLKKSNKTAFDLFRISDYHIHMTAMCHDCGKPAICTRRNVASTSQILVGGKDLYSASCLKHHSIPK